MPPRTRIEVKGFGARFYDQLLWLITLGGYQRLLRRAVELMGPRRGERLLELGSGTGYVARLVAEHVGPEGYVLGLDIGPEMLRRARARCQGCENVEFRAERIDEPLPYEGEFDKVFASFVLHGFEQPQRELISANAYRALKPGGEFFILDWGRFALGEAPFLLRLFFRTIECELAQEFIQLDLEGMLAEEGFRDFRGWPLWGRYLRLLGARKGSQPYLVEPTGLEPVTSCMPYRRSPN